MSEQSALAAATSGESDQHHGNQNHADADAGSAAHGVDGSLDGTEGIVNDAHEMIPNQSLSPKSPASAGAGDRNLPAGSLQPS